MWVAQFFLFQKNETTGTSDLKCFETSLYMLFLMTEMDRCFVFHTSMNSLIRKLCATNDLSFAFLIYCF